MRLKSQFKAVAQIDYVAVPWYFVVSGCCDFEAAQIENTVEIFKGFLPFVDLFPRYLCFDNSEFFYVVTQTPSRASYSPP